MALDMLDWSAINVGDEVEILDGRAVIARGIVDALTDTKEVLWLLPSFGGTGSHGARHSYDLHRRMFHRIDGWGVRVIGTGFREA